MAKKIAQLTKPFINRIVGHGEEAVDQLLANPLNFRLHPDNQQQALAGAIDDIGFIRSVTVNQRTGRVVDGHLRVTLAARSNVETLPVEYVDLTEAEEAQALVSLDPIAALAATDKAKLDELMRSVQSDDARVQTMLAEMAEREGLEYGKAEPATGEAQEPDIDKADELQAKWNTASGQVWQIGEHRLICGDSTDPATIDKLMQGEKAQILFTSPPYAQQRDYRDDATDKVSDWDALMRGVFANAPMTDDGQILVNLGLVHREGEWIPYWEKWIDWMRSQGWRRFGWYVWDKLCGLPGDHGGRLAPAHEFVFHFNKEPVKPNKNIPTINAGSIVKGHNRQKDGTLTKQTGYGDAVQDFRIADSVFRRGAEKGAHGIDHPAIMSANFAKMAVNAYPGTIVFEPFGGSGTTIVACERLGRKCRAVEISPAYVAVALERWSTMTGQTPVLLTP